MKTLKVATVCSGIGSPEKALENLGIPHEITFACEIDKYARQTYLANFNPKIMLEDMTAESWEGDEYYADLFIGGIPCQAFSLAGKRLGELDPRGLLFYDFYKYVKVQQPKYLIIENVKGLLSDAEGATFQNWINLLGQSVNGDQFMFPHEDSLMYNLHWQVLNTKDYGVPQNRERVFLVGIRNDLPNHFVFPKPIPLKLRLKDILEDEVEEKYYLSEKMINGFVNHAARHQEKGNGFTFKPTEGENVAVTITTHEGSRGYNNFIKVGNTNPSGNGMNGNVFSENGTSPTLTTNKGEGLKIQVKSATKSGYEKTLDTACNQAVVTQLNSSLESGGKQPYQQNRVYDSNGIAPALCNAKSDLNVTEPKIGSLRGRNPENPKSRESGLETVQMLEINENGTSNCLTSVQKDNVVIEPPFIRQKARGYNEGADLKICPTITINSWQENNHLVSDYRIRKLTTKECFRLQGFPDEFHDKAVAAGVSNSQLYKQAGNSITVDVIQAILKNLLK